MVATPVVAVVVVAAATTAVAWATAPITTSNWTEDSVTLGGSSRYGAPAVPRTAGVSRFEFNLKIFSSTCWLQEPVVEFLREATRSVSLMNDFASDHSMHKETQR
jgi:hypothetical protein